MLFLYINRHPRPVSDLSRSGAHPFLHGLHEICSWGLPTRKRGFLREIKGRRLLTGIHTIYKVFARPADPLTTSERISVFAAGAALHAPKRP